MEPHTLSDDDGDDYGGGLGLIDTVEFRLLFVWSAPKLRARTMRVNHRLRGYFGTGCHIAEIKARSRLFLPMN